MRVSDTERQRTVDELRRHCAAGRIDMDEYGRRIERAMAAERLEELDAVLSDLPILRIADPSAPGESNGRQRRASREHRRGTGLLNGAPSLSGGRGPADEGSEQIGSRSDRPAGRAATRVTALLVVALIVAAVLLVVAASWTWAVVLIGGWVLGLAQAALSRRRSG